MTSTNVFETHGLSWEQLGRLGSKHAWLMLAVFLSVVVGTWSSLQIFFSDLYESKAALLVKIGRETAEAPVTLQNGTIISQGVRAADINSEVQLLASRSIVESVVDQIGEERFKSVLPEPDSLLGYPKYLVKLGARWAKGVWKDFLIAASLKKRLTPREDAVVAVMDGTKVEPVKESDVLVLKVRTRDPLLSTDIASIMLQEYFERRAEIRMNPASSAFFDAHVEANEQMLRKLQELRASLRKEWVISSPADERPLLLRQLSEIQSLRAVTEGEIGRLANEARTMSQQIKAVPDFLVKEEVSAQNPSIQSLKERITSLSMERAKLLGRYKPESEVIRKVSGELAELESALLRESATILTSVTSERNPLAKSLTYDMEQRIAQLQGMQGRAATLSGPAGRIRANLAKLDEGADRMEAIEREYRLAENNYVNYAKKREEARIAEALDARRAANVSIIAAPDTPIEPAAPRKMLIMYLSLAAGVLLAVFAAVVAESLDSTIRSGRDMSEIPGLEFLGDVRWNEESRMSPLSLSGASASTRSVGSA